MSKKYIVTIPDVSEEDMQDLLYELENVLYWYTKEYDGSRDDDGHVFAEVNSIFEFLFDLCAVNVRSGQHKFKRVLASEGYREIVEKFGAGRGLCIRELETLVICDVVCNRVCEILGAWRESYLEDEDTNRICFLNRCFSWIIWCFSV